MSSYPIRFTRQKIIDNYILDFYCNRKRIAIELDGSQHYTEEGLEYDENRTRILEGYDITVIRILNYDVNRHFMEVCEYIDYIVKHS